MYNDPIKIDFNWIENSVHNCINNSTLSIILCQG